MELPPGGDNRKEAFEFIRPSEKAQGIGRKVRLRVLSRLGLTDLGSYIARQRNAEKLKPREISRQIKLSREALHELETNRLAFFELPPSKAADLVDTLKLDPGVVLSYLGALDLSQFANAPPTSLFRVDRGLDEEKRMELERQAHTSAEGNQDKKQQLEVFVKHFVAELTKRGHLKG